MEKMSGWTLFSIRGVDVKIHLSLLFLLLYVLLVATASFPLVVQSSGTNPAEITGSPVTWSLIFAFALLTSIFVHEFSHVLMAQAKGIKVRQISLMMLGGASHMEHIPEEPMTEFKVAIIGPLVSLAIAGLLFWIRSVTNSANLAFFGFWVGQTNLVLAIFNLIPAFPTDGGRVLRALLVTRLGRLRGTEVAVQVSHVFAWLFGLIGFFYFNILLILIAFYLYAAAKAELWFLWGQTILKDLKVRDILTRTPGLSSNSTLSQAASEMIRMRQRILPLNDSPEAPSVVTSEMINRIPRNLWEQTLVKEITAPLPKAITTDESLNEVWQLLLTSPSGGLPVIENQQVVGIIRSSDLVDAFELQRLSDGSKTTAGFPWSVKVQFPKTT